MTIAVLAASLVGASAVQAATFNYQLGDHPNGGASSTYGYGLRLDRENPSHFFSFDNGAQAYLQYDSTAGSATLYGTVVRSLGNGNYGATYQFSYFLNGLTDNGAGGFTDFAGNGSGTVFGAGAMGSDLLLGAAAKSSGEYFIFGLDALSNRPFTGYEGTGWVQKDPGANDFLFTATTVTTPPPPPPAPPVPLPAAGWMLLAGLGGMGLMRRRKKNS